MGRVKRNLLKQSYIGAIFTNGHPERGRSGQTYGADMRLATSRFLGQPRNMVFNAFATRSANKGVSDDDWACGFALVYPNDKIRRAALDADDREELRAGAGFVQRDNVRMVRAAASYNPRPRNFLNVQQFNHDIYFTHFTRLDNGETESWDLYVTLLDWLPELGRQPARHVRFQPDLRAAVRAVRDLAGREAAAGQNAGSRASAAICCRRRRSAGSPAASTCEYGGYWSGHAEQVTTAVTYKLPPRFTFIFSTNQTFARLPEGHFIARIFTSNVNYAFSPRLSLTNLIQYDNRSRNLGWQSRVRWTLQPGNDLFFVFNQGWIEEQEPGSRRHAEIPHRRYQGIREVPVFVPGS